MPDPQIAHVPRPYEGDFLEVLDDPIGEYVRRAGGSRKMPWTQASDIMKRTFGIDPTPLKDDFTLAAWDAAVREVKPYGSFADRVARYATGSVGEINEILDWDRKYQDSLERFEKGQATPWDFHVISSYRYRKELEANKSLGESITDTAMSVPVLAGEFLTGGRLAGLAGRGLAKTALKSLPSTSARVQALLTDATIGARMTQGAVATPAVPATYLGLARANAERWGGDPTDPQNLLPAIGVASLQNAILGQLSFKADPGRGYLSELVTRTGMAIGEQQAFDIVATAIDREANDVVGITLGLDTNYGVLGDLMDKDPKTNGVRRLVEQAVLFGGFAAIHGDPGHVARSLKESLNRYRRRGVSVEAAADQLVEAARTVADRPEARTTTPVAEESRPYVEAVRQVADRVSPEGPDRWYELLSDQQRKELARALSGRDQENPADYFQQMSPLQQVKVIGALEVVYGVRVPSKILLKLSGEVGTRERGAGEEGAKILDVPTVVELLDRERVKDWLKLLTPEQQHDLAVVFGMPRTRKNAESFLASLSLNKQYSVLQLAEAAYPNLPIPPGLKESLRRLAQLHSGVARNQEASSRTPEVSPSSVSTALVPPVPVPEPSSVPGPLVPPSEPVRPVEPPPVSAAPWSPVVAGGGMEPPVSLSPGPVAPEVRPGLEVPVTLGQQRPSDPAYPIVPFTERPPGPPVSGEMLPADVLARYPLPPRDVGVPPSVRPEPPSPEPPPEPPPESPPPVSPRPRPPASPSSPAARPGPSAPKKLVRKPGVIDETAERVIEELAQELNVDKSLIVQRLSEERAVRSLIDEQTIERYKETDPAVYRELKKKQKEGMHFYSTDDVWLRKRIWGHYLEERHHDILERRLNGETLESIAASYGMSFQAVSQQEQRIMTWLGMKGYTIRLAHAVREIERAQGSVERTFSSKNVSDARREALERQEAGEGAEDRGRASYVQEVGTGAQLSDQYSEKAKKANLRNEVESLADYIGEMGYTGRKKNQLAKLMMEYTRAFDDLSQKPNAEELIRRLNDAFNREFRLITEGSGPGRSLLEEFGVAKTGAESGTERADGRGDSGVSRRGEGGEEPSVGPEGGQERRGRKGKGRLKRPDDPDKLYAMMVPIPPEFMRFLETKKPESADPEVDTSSAIPPIQSYATFKTNANNPTGIERVPGVGFVGGNRVRPDSLQSVLNAHSVLSAMSTGLADSAIYKAMAELKVRSGADIFKPSAIEDGTVTLGEGGHKGYLSDVVEQEIANPGSQPLNDLQRRFVQWVARVNEEMMDIAAREGMKLVVTSDGQAVRPGRAYMHRKVVGHVDQGAFHGVASASTSRVPGAVKSFQKHRRYATEREGYENGVRYEMDAFERVRASIEQFYQQLADHRMVKDMVQSGLAVKVKGRKRLVSGDRIYGIPAFMPRIRAVVDRDTGQVRVLTSALEFSPETRGRIESHFSRSVWLDALERASSEIKSLKFGFPDPSVLFNQLLLVAFGRPSAWVKSARAWAGSLTDPLYFRRYATLSAENVKAIQEYVQSQGTLMFPEQIEATQAGLTGRLRPFRAGGRAFGDAINVAKVELWKAWSPEVPREHWVELARTIDAITNTGSGRMRGLSDHRVKLERIFLTAPNILRAGLDIAGAAALGSGPVRERVLGVLARTALGVTALSVAGMVYAGLSRREIEERLDPRKGKFLMVPVSVPGSDRVESGLGGVVISLVRLAGEMIEHYLDNRHDVSGVAVAEQPDVVLRWLRGRLAAIPAAAWDATSHEDYHGRPSSLLKSLMTQAIPIQAEPFVTGPGDIKQRSVESVVGLLGGRSHPESPTTRELRLLDEIARQSRGKDYHELPLLDQFEVSSEYQKRGLDKREEPTSTHVLRALEEAKKSRDRIEGQMAPESLKKLERLGYRIPSDDGRLTLEGVNVVLTKDRRKAYEQLVAKRYDEVIQRLPDAEELIREYGADVAARFVAMVLERAKMRAVVDMIQESE